MSGPTVVVVGAGVMGLGAGAALAEAGANVTVLERYHVAHDWASSHGLSRAIRHEYGPLAQYTAMVARSLVLWDELARETVRRLYIETGVLTLGQPDDGHTLPGLEVMRAQGLPAERLSSDECERRFPQFRAGDFGAITWNPRGGMLRATECCLALAERIRAHGGTIREGAQVTRVEPHGDGGRVWLASGETLTADRVVVAAGPWIADVLPDLHIPVRVSRQQVCYFSGLDEETFGVGRFPVFLSGMNQYGFPMHGPGWLKVGLHDFGATVDPNQGYEPDMDEVEAVRDVPARGHSRRGAGGVGGRGSLHVRRHHRRRFHPRLSSWRAWSRHRVGLLRARLQVRRAGGAAALRPCARYRARVPAGALPAGPFHP